MHLNACNQGNFFGKPLFRRHMMLVPLYASIATHYCLWDYLQFDSSLVCETRYDRLTLDLLSLYSI